MGLEDIIKKSWRFTKKTVTISLVTLASYGVMGFTWQGVRDHAVLTASFSTSRVLKEKAQAKQEERKPKYLDEALNGIYFGALTTPYIHHSYGLMNKYFPVNTDAQGCRPGNG